MAGIVLVDREYLVDETNSTLKYNNELSLGFPFELNVKMFNSRKQPYRIYEIIPIGKPTVFANSIAFKFYGDIFKKSFIGIGVTVGYDWHKNY